MGLQNVKQMLMDADKKNTCVIAFDTFNYESIAWLIDVAEEEQIPVINMLYPALKSHIPFEVFASTVKGLASRVKIPIGLHLDHSRSFEEIMQAIKAGFTSVMFDGSALPFEDNVRITKQVVEAAHPMGVDVEAELGLVGFASNLADFKDSSRYTKPEEAKEFVERTGVDYLAIAIGSAHGNYVATPKLDLGRLTEVNNTISTPLVLHGGTGIPDDQLKQAFKLGMNKLNVGTELGQLFYSKTKEIVESGKKIGGYLDLLNDLKTEMKEYYRVKINLTKV